MSQPAAPLPPLSGSRLLLATLGLSLATFMNVLDTTIANVSIPAIAGNVGVSPSQGTWVITSFAVANAIAVPLTGWLSQRLGQLRLFLGSVVLFVIASMLCGMASSLEMLLVFRVLQGLVAGPMTPLSQSLLLQSFPPTRRGMALALWGMTATAAPIFGPLLGGWLTDNFSWPWIFYINLPVGLFAAWLTWKTMHGRETPIVRLPIDFTGLALLVLWVGAFQVMLDQGRELDWFNSAEIVVLAIVAAFAFCLFLVWELTEAHPVVDLRLFQRRNFSVGAVSLALGYGLFFGNVVLMPLWLQEFMGYTATWAGLVTMPVGVVAMLLSPLVGRTLQRVDPRLYASVAFFVFALATWLRAGFNLEVDAWPIVLSMLIQGAAMATFFTPLTAITLSGLPPERIAAASGLSNFLRITMGAVGSSVWITLWDRRASLHHAQLTENVSAFSATSRNAVDGMGALGLTPGQAIGLIEQDIVRQAYMLATSDLFWLSTALFVALSGMIWFSRRTQSRPPAGAAEAAH